MFGVAVIQGRGPFRCRGNAQSKSKKLRRNEVNNNHSKKFWGGKAAYFIIPGLLAAFAAAAIAPLPTAGHNNFLVRFDHAIGGDPISNVVLTGTTVTASPNVVRGISPAGQIWRIDDLD